MIIQRNKPRVTLRAYRIKFQVIGSGVVRASCAYAPDEDHAKQQIRKRETIKGNRISSFQTIQEL